MSVAELDEAGRRRVLSPLEPGEPALSVDELREELVRLSAAKSEEFERAGPTKRFRRLQQDRERFRRELLELAPADPLLERLDQEDEAQLVRLHGHQARRFAAIIAAPARTPRDWAILAHTYAAGASRRKAIARLGGKLLAHGVDPELVLELMYARNAWRSCPPLAPHEVTAVVRWALAHEIERLEGAA